MKCALYFIFALVALTTTAPLAKADPKEIARLRDFYRQHNLDFFGDLIVDHRDIMADERKHAKLELLADDARTKALSQLERLLARAKGGMRAELLIRKATLLSDRARTATYFQNNPVKTKRLKAPSVYLQQSIKTFLQVERGYRHHPKMDVVTFSIAYNYGELKKHDDAFRYYDKLVRSYPESSLVGDARLAMAEILFDKRKFAKSLEQLRAIVKSEHPRLKNFALYKMAWTYYNMSDLDSAVESLERVVAGVNALGVQNARLELRREALHDLVLFYSERPEPNAASEARQYFSRIAKTPDAIAAQYAATRMKRIESYLKKKAPIPEEETDAYQLNEADELLFRLTNTYRNQGKHQYAMTVAEQLIASLDMHPKVPMLYRLRAESAEKLRRRDLVLAELKRLAEVVKQKIDVVKRYSDGLPGARLPDMSKYFGKVELDTKQLEAPSIETQAIENIAQKADEQTAENFYRKNLLKISLETFKDFTNFLHGEWLKTNNAETASAALASYDTALGAMLAPWRGHPIEDCLELRYRRAQLRFAMRKWLEASDDYAWLAVRLTKNRDEALRGDIASLEALLKAQPIKATPKNSLHPVHKRLLEAYDAFLAYNLTQAPMRKLSANVLAASARLFNEYGDTKEALARMKTYTLQMHDQPDATALTKDVLAILERQGAWAPLRDYSDRIIELGHYKKTEISKELDRANEFASLKLLEQLEKEQDWKSAAEEFASFAKKKSDSPFVSQALMKSANAALQMKDDELAIRQLEAATKAPDPSVRLQAWLGLEPFYRKAFQWNKLETLYNAVLKLKADKQNIADARKNLAAIDELKQKDFAETGEKLIDQDGDVSKLAAILEKFDHSTADFRRLRFVKSNNNPALNFKKKADLHAKLSNAVEKTMDRAPKSLKGAAALWGNVVKAELLLEFAETVQTAAIPSALKQASEADRKAYGETITSQVNELREKARSFAAESKTLALKIECPLPLESRLNKLLEATGDNTRFARPLVTALWSKRPVIKPEKLKSPEEKITDLGLSVIKAKEQEDYRENVYELAEVYHHAEEPGFAYAVASTLTTKQDEYGARSTRLLFTIDSERLPARLKKALATESAGQQMNAQERWDLARWIATQKILAEKAREGGFSENELKWFSDATDALLKLVPSTTVTHTTKLSQK